MTDTQQQQTERNREPDRWDPPGRLYQSHPVARGGIRDLGAERPWRRRGWRERVLGWLGR